MSEYGVKINNFTAGSLYEYILGTRDRVDSKPAMLSNSLFLDFLLENKLKVNKRGATRDVICIDFKYGSKSYEEETNNIRNMIKKNKHKPEFVEKLKKALERAEKNKDKYDKMSKESLRYKFYEEGIDIPYVTKNKDGEVIKTEVIHYEMLFRSTGKAKGGSCIFIKKSLFKKAQRFLRMGIKMKKKNAPIVEMGAYSSLVASGICGRVKIIPENILILKDFDSFFETKVISVETDAEKHCLAKRYDKYKLKNTIFDGQALIDESIFPKWGNGYILLRHHFTKMAAFKAKIQKFFKDYYGDRYETATITDMFGVEHKVKDIQVITTDNAVKWLKFGVSYQYWCDWVHANGCTFGIVKTAHESKLGNVQRMSYQMVNALELEDMEDIISCSKNYIESMKKDDLVFLDYLRKNCNFSNDYEALVALCEQDMTFTRSEYFRDRKRKIIEAYTKTFKGGRINQNADNLVIVGSPFAMLLYAVGENPEEDPTLEHEDGTIQCYTKRFEDNEYLAFFRSPFNSRNNMSYLHNHYHEYFDKYFDFGKLIIAVNMIHTDFQDRNNGSDQDSDSGYTTNQKSIVKCAKKCYAEYPTIVNNIPKEKNSYDNTLHDFATIDNNLAEANKAIGGSSNIAQIGQSYTYNFKEQKYSDYVCILSVLAQVAIDNAKRRFDIDLVDEISRIKADMNVKEIGFPSFWKLVKENSNKKNKVCKKKTRNDFETEEEFFEYIQLKKEVENSKINEDLICPMNYVYKAKVKNYRSSESTLPMDEFFVKHSLDKDKKQSKKVESLIEKYSLNLGNNGVSSDEEYLLMRNDFDELISDIKKVYISNNYIGLISWLIDRAFCITNYTVAKKECISTNTIYNKAILLNVLYSINKESFLKCFSKNAQK